MEDRIDRISAGAESGARGLVDNVQDVAARAQGVASRAGSYVQARVGRASERASDYAHDVAQHANDRLERVTGRSVQSWSGDARRFVQDHPLQAIALTVGVGFLLGKLLRRE